MECPPEDIFDDEYICEPGEMTKVECKLCTCGEEGIFECPIGPCETDEDDLMENFISDPVSIFKIF